MNIKKLINKLFKTKKKSYGLALPTDLVSVPMRDNLTSDKIKELDEYKDNYLKLLEAKKHFTSHDIEAADFNQEMIMNFELFGRLVINHDSNYNLSTMADYEKRELWLKQKVIPRKIKLYIDKMESMFNETHLRLIALKEIYSESGKKLSKDKQNAILNEIYNLASKYIIFKNNVYAALKEVETYKTEMTASSIIKNDTIENNALNMHYSNLTSFASYFIPKTLNTIEKMNLDTFDKLVYLERELEIYAYNNLKIDDLNHELEYIDKIEKTPDNRKILLEMINELEIKYLVLNDYSGHELDLKPLYEVKFDILIIDIIHQKDSPFKDISNNKEFKYYEDIILDKITTNITGIDSILNNQLNNNKNLITDVVNILKVHDYLDQKEKYNFSNILNDKFKLSLILNMVSIEQLKFFFDNYLVDLHHENIVTTNYVFPTKKYKDFRDAFLFEDFISLSNACRIMRFYNQIGVDDYVSSKAQSLLKIYEFFVGNSSINADEFKLVEGLKEVDMPYIMHFKKDMFMDYLCNIINHKTLIMPSTLEYLNISFCGLDKIVVPHIFLNEGLQKITGTFDFKKMKTTSLMIPSSLVTFSFYGELVNIGSVNKLIFTNFTKSNMFNDKEVREYIIKEMCERSFADLIDMIREVPNIDNLKSPFRKIVLVSNDEIYTIPINEIVREFALVGENYYRLKSPNDIYYGYDIVKSIQKHVILQSTDKVENEINNIMKSSIKKR